MSNVERTSTRIHTLRTSVVLAIIFAAAGIGCTSGAGNAPSVSNDALVGTNKTTASNAGDKTKLEIPSAITAEHRELHEELEKAINLGGKTGEAAKLVEERLSHHFEKEEEYALPQLGLLGALAAGNVSPGMKDAITLSDKLKADLPKMLEEHKGIVEALNSLTAASKSENKPEGAAFAAKLSAHAQNEEQVMYPAAILVGEYLKLALKP